MSVWRRSIPRLIEASKEPLLVEQTPVFFNPGYSFRLLSPVFLARQPVGVHPRIGDFTTRGPIWGIPKRP